jgi:hypothetical protein
VTRQSRNLWMAIGLGIVAVAVYLLYLLLRMLERAA